MTLRWLEGFEGISTLTSAHARLYATATGTIAPENGASEPTDEAISGYDLVLETPVLVPAVASEWIIGFAMRGDGTTSINGGSIPFIGFDDAVGEQCRLEILEANVSKPGGRYFQWRLVRGSTTLVTSTDLFYYLSNDDRTWVYFEFKVTISDASGVIEGRYQHINKPMSNPSGAPTTMSWDGATTGLDTKEQAAGGADRVTISLVTGSANDRVAIDDLYIMDSAGAANNDWVGKIIIEGQKPSATGGGDGDTVDWTLADASSTQDAWDEPLTSVDDDGRVTSDTVSQVHLAVMDPLVNILGGTIIGVRQDIHCRMETTGDLDIGHFYRKTTGSPAETTDGTDLNVDSTSMEAHADVQEDDPNTGSPWVVADMDSYQHGVINNG